MKKLAKSHSSLFLKRKFDGVLTIVIAKSYRVSEYFPESIVLRDGSFSHLDEVDASSAGALAYCQNLHYLEAAVKNPNVTAIVTSPALVKEIVDLPKAVIAAEDPRLAFFSLYMTFHEAGFCQPSSDFGVGSECHIHPTAVISDKARIGNRVEIGANAVIEDFVNIMDDVYIASNVTVGAEGLITLRCADSTLLNVRHAGGVEVGSGAQIFAGAVIAKSLFRSYTRIGRNCQIGILANVGHGASIGDNSVISGNTVIAGRTKVGSNVWVGASASIAQGLQVGEGAQIKMGSVVVGNVGRNQIVSGNFAVSHAASMRHFFKIRAYETR